MTGLQAFIVDDEVQIRRFLRISLEANGYQVYEAENGKTALAEIPLRHPDLVLLDLGLPDMDGITVLKRLREWTQTPVIVLSVRSSDKDKIAALDAGADDYLTKPFSIGELLARLRVAQRHAHPEAESVVFQSGSLQVDLSQRIVTVDGHEVKLTPTEYAMLQVLIRHVGKVVTHKQLLREVWGTEYSEETHYLRVYVGQLRHKIEADPTHPRLILTEPGIGYRLVMVEDEKT
jgi:two-component system KDP operon response regulator KdpE